MTTAPTHPPTYLFNRHWFVASAMLRVVSIGLGSFSVAITESLRLGHFLKNELYLARVLDAGKSNGRAAASGQALTLSSNTAGKWEGKQVHVRETTRVSPACSWNNLLS